MTSSFPPLACGSLRVGRLSSRPPGRAARLLGAAVLALSCAAVAAGEAGAHGRSTSTSTWELGAEGARVLLRVQLADLQRALPEMAGVTPEYLATSPALQRRVQD